MPCHHYTTRELLEMEGRLDEIAAHDLQVELRYKLWNLQYLLSNTLNTCREAAIWDQVPLDSKQWMQWYETYILQKDTRENVYT